MNHQQNQTLTLADQLVFINTEISCWSGKKTLTVEDLGLDPARLPPETLVSLGSKQLISPDVLRTFTSIRGTARRHCLAVGTRFMGGYAVPTAKASALLDQLADLEVRYQEAKSDFLANYDQALEAWAVQQPPEWQTLIRDALVPAAYVGGRLNFRVQVAKFSNPEPEVVQHEGLNQAIAGLSDQVFYEIAQEAKEALERSFQGKQDVTRRALSPLVTIQEKLSGLVFIDQHFRVVIGEIDRLLASIPAKGPISGSVMGGLTQFLALAAQPAGLRTWAQAAPVWSAPQDELACWPLAEHPCVLLAEDDCLDQESLPASASLSTALTEPEAEAAEKVEAEPEPDPDVPVEGASTAEPEAAGDWFF